MRIIKEFREGDSNKERERGKSVWSSPDLSLFSLSFQDGKTRSAQEERKKKKEHGKKDRLIFPVSISFLFFFFVSSKFPFFFFFVLKIRVCIYFLVGFNLFDFLLIRVF